MGTGRRACRHARSIRYVHPSRERDGDRCNVTITFLLESRAPVTRTYIVPATSRFNVHPNDISELRDRMFGALIEVTNGVPISVSGRYTGTGTSRPGAAGPTREGPDCPESLLFVLCGLPFCCW